MLKRILLLFTYMILFVGVYAQTASFTANQTSGCPNPMLLSLTSTSTGGPFSSYSWTLTGPVGFTTQTSSANPFTTTLSIPGFYSVTLTVCNGANCDTETQTNYIEVFERPTINMNIGNHTGCPPLQVCFDGTFTAGCGTIASSIIDARDGTVYNNVEDFCHVYTNSGNYSNFVVVVENSCGCSTSQTYNDVVSVTAAPVANFTQNNSSACNPPLSVTFTNTSTSTVAGTTYEWNIPGQVSGITTPNLTHNFTAAGSYDVQLIVSNPNGCSDTLTRVGAVVIGNQNAIFSANDSTICTGQSVNFFDLSSGNPTSWSWTFEGHGTSSNENPSVVFNTVGTWDVTLNVSYPGGCTGSITMPNFITVLPKPVNSYTVSNTTGCQTPFTTTFTSTATNTTSTTWSFPGGTPSTYTGNGPVNVTYNSFGNYNVTMNSTNNGQCSVSNTFNSVISVNPLTIDIIADQNGGCIPHTANLSYTVTPNQTIASQTWTLPGSNIGSSTSATPSPTYNTEDCFDVQLQITTTGGCTANTTRNNFICAGTQPTNTFTYTPSTICFEEEDVCLTYTGTGADTIMWDFGDSSPNVWTADDESACYPYNQESGTFTLTMVAFNNGCASDTARVVDAITVNEPVSSFSGVFAGCSNWNTFNFTDGSTGADSVFYTFGDPTTINDTSSVRNPQWVYPNDDTIRTYTVTQYTYNFATGCEHQSSITVSVYPPMADFGTVGGITSGCAPLRLYLNNTSPYITGTTRWNLVGTNQFSGSGYGTIWTAGNTPAPTFNIGSHTITMINIDNRGCRDTIVKPNYIRVHGVIPGFTSSTNTVCLPQSVSFTDTSRAPLSYIARWHWDFGDPFTLSDTSNVQNPTYNYTLPGTYIVSLTATDSFGCEATAYDTINVFAPNADFTLSDTFICNNQQVSLTNNSTGNNLTYNWDFGVGATPSTSTAQNPPDVTYNTEGTYNVFLEVTDSVGCTNDTSVTLHVFDPVLQASAGLDSISCFSNITPITFPNTSYNNIDSSSAYWNFGNGVISTTISPTVIYNVAGTYEVTMSIATNSGCRDTIIVDTIYVGGPYANIEVLDRDSICNCDSVRFQVTTVNSPNVVFLYGDGNSINYNPVGNLGDTIVDTLNYQYCDIGSYIPQVFIDDGTCSGLVSNDTIMVDSIVVDFDVVPYSICDTGTVCFTDASYHEIVGDTAISSWHWDFGDGNTSNLQNPCHLYTDTGFFDVTLVVVSNYTCSDSITYQIYIPPSPVAQIARSDSNGCVGITISFYDSSSVSSNTFTETWHWDFGDNTITTDTANTQNTSYQYNTAGIYWISLTITDTFGCSSIDSVQIEVFDLPIVTAGMDTTICYEDSTVLQAGGALTYMWLPTYNILNENTATPTVFPSVDTSYYVMGTDVNGCENYDTIFIKVNNIQANFSVDSVCLGTVSNYTDLSTSDTTINSWLWTFDEPASGANDTSNVQNPTHTYATNGIYNATLRIIDDAGCLSDTTLPAIVFDVPVASFTADSVCIGLANTFNSDSSFGGGANIVDYFWNFGQNPEDTSHLANPTFVYNNPGLYNVCLTITTSQNCVGNSDDTCFTVQVYPLPNVSAGNDQIICENDSVQLLATGANTYVWSPNYQVSDINIQNPWVSPLVDTAYVVTGTDTNTCVNIDTVNVSVNFVTAYFEADSVCIGGTTNFNDLSVVDGTIQNWNWNFDDPASGANNTSTLQNPTHIYTSTGTFNVALSITDNNGCVNDTIVQVIVYEAPVASFTADSVCLNQTNTFNSSTSYGGGATIVDYFWNFGQNPEDTSHLANPTFVYNNSGLYNVCLTITTNQNCSNNFDDTCFTVQVYELPTASFEVDSACDGTAINFVNTSTNGNDATINTSFWNFGQTPADVQTINGPPSNTQFTYNTSGVYTTTLTVTDGNSCQSTATKDVYVFDVPVSNFTFTSNCQNQNNEFTATPTNVTSAINYYWNFDEGAGYITGDSIENYVFNNAGVHNVSLIVENTAGCADTLTQIVNVSQAPTAIITGDSVLCEGVGTQLSGGNSISAVPITTYVWNISPNQTSNITYLPNADITVTLHITNADGCTDSTSMFVNVIEKPDIDIVAQPACEDIPFNIELDIIASDAPINNYNWTITNNAGSVANYSTNPVSYTATSIDTLTAYVVIEDTAGCRDSITEIILVDEQVYISVLQDEFLICPDEIVYFSLNNVSVFSTSGAIGGISISPITGSEIITADSFALSPTFTTTYTITASSVLGNCPDDDDNSILIDVAPTPFIEISATPNPVIAGATTDISAAVVPFNFNTDSLIWEDVNGTLNRTFGFEIEATPLEETTYPVHLVYAFDTVTCRIDTSITIQVITECGQELVYVPNIFTPNHDGKNDVFKLTGYGIETVTFLRVFDRWGQVMYNGENVEMNNGYMADGWHGDNKNGKECNSGVYVYYYEIICTNGDVVKGSGNVTLIK